MRALDFFFASRPMLQIPVWTVYLVALHYHHALSGETFAVHDLLILFGLSLLASGAFYLNQVFDFETDCMNNKVMFLKERLLSRQQMILAYILTAVPALSIGVFVSTLTAGIFACLLALAHLYSAPPARLKDRPIAALIANSLGHGFFIAVAVMPEMTVHNTGLLGWDNPVYFALSVGGVYLVTTIPDIRGDMFAGKRTMAVWLGRKITLLVALALQVTAATVALNSGYLLLSALAVLAALLCIVTIIVRGERIVLISAKLPLLFLTLLACRFYPLYLLFLVVLVLVARAYYRKRFSIVYPRIV